MIEVVLKLKSAKSLRHLSEALKLLYKHNEQLSKYISNKQPDAAIMRAYFKDKLEDLRGEMEAINQKIEEVEILQLTTASNELATNEEIIRNKINP